MTRFRGTRSREIRLVSRERDDILAKRTWQYPRKIFYNVYIRAARLIVKNCTCDLFPEWQWSSCLLRLFHIASVIGAWEAGFVAAHVNESEGWPSLRFRCECCHSLIQASTRHVLLSSSTDTRDVKQVLKTFNSAFMLLLIQKEQHKRSFQPHNYFCVTDI